MTMNDLPRDAQKLVEETALDPMVELRKENLQLRMANLQLQGRLMQQEHAQYEQQLKALG